MKKILSMLACCTLMLAACHSADAGGDAAVVENNPLNVQFVPTNNDGTMEARSEEFAAYLSEALGREVNVTVATNFNTIVEAMVSGQVDLGIMPPAAFVQARERGGARAILSSVLGAYDRETGLPIEGEVRDSFKGEILVRADSDLHELADLVGANIGTLSPSSASGFIYPIVEMMDAGIDPLTDVTLVTVNDIPSGITGVLNGQLDATFVFEGARVVFNGAFPDDELMDELRVLHLTEGDIPNDAIAVHPDMDEELVAQIKEAFLAMPDTDEGLEIMSLWGHRGYMVADESNYDTIRDYIERAAELE
ncbi:MAG: phosphate/phosphite/phosphonate ABC transporter substrate-binding protein [Turicibacter sp.]|nr:phosphate/phosphite/phosphonate ABC transporter substrate-binding protein [Turicibacter sp.]